MHSSSSARWLAIRHSLVVVAASLFVPLGCGQMVAQQPAATPASSSQQAPVVPPVASPNQSVSVQERVHARKAQRRAAAINDVYSHKYEFFVGGAYVRFLPGPVLQHIDEIGWNVTINRNYNRKWAAVLDTRGYYGNAYVYNNEYSIFKPAIYQYALLVGPQYRAYAAPRFSASARLLGGATYGDFDGDAHGIPANYLNLYPNGLSMAIGLGAPLDVNLSPTLAIRVTPEYYLTHFGSEFQHNKAINFGIIYRRQKQ